MDNVQYSIEAKKNCHICFSFNKWNHFSTREKIFARNSPKC